MTMPGKLHRLASPRVAGIAPYVPGMTVEEVARRTGRHPSTIIKLASNENAGGPAPAAARAFRKSAQLLHRYPESAAPDLTAEIARRNGVPVERILVTDSGNHAINYLSLAFLDPGDNIVCSRPSFPMNLVAAAYQGAQVNFVSVTPSYTHDLDGLLRAMDRKTKIVWIDSPINPLGTIAGRRDLEKFLARVPETALVVLDEAYRDYAEGNPEYPTMEETRSFQERFQVVVLRTYSKILGMADLRAGYLMGDPTVVETLHRVHSPFYLSRHTQDAVLAGIKMDGKFVAKTVESNNIEKARLYSELDRLRIRYVKSDANFIFYPCSEPVAVFERFIDFGIIVRPIGRIGIRVTIGKPEENSAFLAALEEVRRDGLI